MKCAGCKKQVLYIAEDGHKFDTEAECDAYNNQPKVYVVSIVRDYRAHAHVVQAFLSKEEAIAYTRRNDELCYDVDQVDVTLPQKLNTVQEKITNTKKTKNWWTEFWEVEL